MFFAQAIVFGFRFRSYLILSQKEHCPPRFKARKPSSGEQEEQGCQAG